MSSLAPASRLLHYAIQHQLGAGGMGVVYRALDTRLDRAVALKFLPEALSVDAEAKRRLVQEAKAAANLDHPNVGVIYGIEEAEGRLFIAMALYEGRTLEACLADGPVAPVDAGRWCLRAASGLAKAHDAGLVHRDIKPGNLFLTTDGLLKILDFGLVKLETSPGLTMPGTIVGTPEYMAPEQIRGRPADARVDVWALGVVLYEALSGISPFRSEGGLPATILRVMTETPAPFAEVAPAVPLGFQGVVERALAKDPEQRYATVREFAADLEMAVAQAEGGARRTAPAAAPPPSPSVAGASGAGLSEGASPGVPPATVSVTGLSVGPTGASKISPLLEPVPRVARFVGRERELAELCARIQRSRTVAIRAMAGEGKSALGARLARDLYPEERVCWFTFDPIEKNSVDALFWSLAAFLASAGEDLLWKYLQGEIEAHRPLDRTVRLNLFLSSLGATGFAFCFDEVHLVAHDAEIAETFKSLQRAFADAAQGGGAGEPSSLVVMGRELPNDLDHLAVPLGGFSCPEAEALLAAHGLTLPARLLVRLHERTHGHPTLLEIAASALSRMGDDHDAMAAFIESMAGKSDVREYVMHHIYTDLEDSEKAVLDALSIFPAAVDLEVAEETLAEAGLSAIVLTVESLVQKAIVRELDGGQIRCHDLVREFCYRRLDGKVRRGLHAHAARHYEAKDHPLRAAHHTFEQGEQQRALELLQANVKPIIDGGGAASLLELLLRFDPRHLDDEQQLALVLAKGDALTIRGAYRPALELYEFALDDVLEEEGRGELLARLGGVSNELGEYERAIAFATEGLEAFDLAGDDAGRTRVQRVLGMAQFRLGRLDEARVAFATGLALAQASGDAALAAYLDQYVGIVDMRQERLDEARQRLERSRKAFRAQRDRTGEAEAMGNLAMVYGMLGLPDRERSLQLKVLDILEQVGDVGYLLILYNNLGQSEVRAGRPEAAIGHHERLIALAGRVDHPLWLGAGRVGLAEDYLALGRVAEASEQAEAAHELLRALAIDGPPSVELAMSQRVLGEIALAVGDPVAARAWFGSSIPVFEAAHETEELARSQRGLQQIDASSPSGTEEEQEPDHDQI